MRTCFSAGDVSSGLLIFSAMQQEDDLKALENIVQFARGLGVFFLVLHVYWYCYEWLSSCGLTYGLCRPSPARYPADNSSFLLSRHYETLRLSVPRAWLLRHEERPQRQGRQAAYRRCRLPRLPAVLSERLSAVAARWDRLPGLELHADPWCGLPQPAGRRRVAAAIDETAAYGRSFQ